MTPHERKLACPSCSRPMQLAQVDTKAKPATVTYECTDCEHSISETMDEGPGKRPLQ